MICWVMYMKNESRCCLKCYDTPKFCLFICFSDFYPHLIHLHYYEYVFSGMSLDAHNLQRDLCTKFLLWNVSTIKCYFIGCNYYYFGFGFLHFPIACNRRSDIADSCILQNTGSNQVYILVSNVREQDLVVYGRVFFI